MDLERAVELLIRLSDPLFILQEAHVSVVSGGCLKLHAQIHLGLTRDIHPMDWVRQRRIRVLNQFGSKCLQGFDDKLESLNLIDQVEALLRIEHCCKLFVEMLCNILDTLMRHSGTAKTYLASIFETMSKFEHQSMFPQHIFTKLYQIILNNVSDLIHANTMLRDIVQHGYRFIQWEAFVDTACALEMYNEAFMFVILWDRQIKGFSGVAYRKLFRTRRLSFPPSWAPHLNEIYKESFANYNEQRQTIGSLP